MVTGLSLNLLSIYLGLCDLGHKLMRGVTWVFETISNMLMLISFLFWNAPRETLLLILSCIFDAGVKVQPPHHSYQNCCCCWGAGTLSSSHLILLMGGARSGEVTVMSSFWVSGHYAWHVTILYLDLGLLVDFEFWPFFTFLLFFLTKLIDKSW